MAVRQYWRAVFTHKSNTMDKSIEQQVFELVDQIGEVLLGDIHIIEIEREVNPFAHPPEEYKVTYRLYRANGNCIDMTKTAILDESRHITAYEYEVLQDWEGFKKADLQRICEYLENLFFT